MSAEILKQQKKERKAKKMRVIKDNGNNLVKALSGIGQLVVVISTLYATFTVVATSSDTLAQVLVVPAVVGASHVLVHKFTT